ncbi:hypothetical protein C8U37_101206 [Trichococcus patagoniensis]|uniref:Uncharacterized protein n=1 Tax=Trichococcus patagoniensis TaxID=382641 RepID=A0A2T5IRB4_9LACT|nr:hypothetical protein [Trichococcus patagoniensis]PTQ86365.1 hypothetical protein C8U37_101206 [Trichococcus patagoniensis]
MIDKSLLESKIKEQGILPIEIYNGFEYEDNFMNLVDEKIDSLITFVKSNDLKNIFYCCYNYDQEDIMITDEKIDEEVCRRMCSYDESVIKSFREEVEEFNKKAAAIDISKPYELCFFTIYQGYFIGGRYNDDYLDTEDYYDKLVKIVNKYFSRDEYNKKKEQEYKESRPRRLELLSKIKEYVLNDPEFHKCTNDNLRHLYKSHLYKTNQDYFEYRNIEPYKSIRFIDALWKEHKNKIVVNLELFIGD